MGGPRRSPERGSGTRRSPERGGKSAAADTEPAAKSAGGATTAEVLAVRCIPALARSFRSHRHAPRTPLRRSPPHAPVHFRSLLPAPRR